jgi:hypothetical protein
VPNCLFHNRHGNFHSYQQCEFWLFTVPTDAWQDLLTITVMLVMLVIPVTVVVVVVMATAMALLSSS